MDHLNGIGRAGGTQIPNDKAPKGVNPRGMERARIPPGGYTGKGGLGKGQNEKVQATKGPQGKPKGLGNVKARRLRGGLWGDNGGGKYWGVAPPKGKAQLWDAKGGTTPHGGTRPKIPRGTKDKKNGRRTLRQVEARDSTKERGGTTGGREKATRGKAGKSPWGMLVKQKGGYYMGLVEGPRGETISRARPVWGATKKKKCRGEGTLGPTKGEMGGAPGGRTTISGAPTGAARAMQ